MSSTKIPRVVEDWNIHMRGMKFLISGQKNNKQICYFMTFKCHMSTYIFAKEKKKSSFYLLEQKMILHQVPNIAL